MSAAAAGSGAETGTPFAAFRLAVEYADAELDTIADASWTRQQRLARPPWGVWTVWLGGVAAVAGSFLAVALRATPPRDGTVCLLILGGYWLGFLAEGARVAWANRRARPWLRDDQRDALRGTVLVVSGRGIAVRRGGTRAFHAWHAVTEWVMAGGLILLFTEPNHALAVPERLLTPAQRAQMLARADAARS